MYPEQKASVVAEGPFRVGLQKMASVLRSDDDDNDGCRMRGQCTTDFEGHWHFSWLVRSRQKIFCVTALCLLVGPTPHAAAKTNAVEPTTLKHPQQLTIPLVQYLVQPSDHEVAHDLIS